MIIDFHTHIFPDELRASRQSFFEGEPAFELLYKPLKSPMAGAKDLIAAMDEQGVDKSVTFGFPWKNMELAQRHNDYVLEVATKHPQRLIPFCCFDAGHPDAAAEAERCLDAGHKGIGELAFYEKGIDDAALESLAPVMELALEHGVCVLVHSNEPVGHVYPGKTPITMMQLWNLALRFPKNRIVLAHWGGGIFFYHLLKRQAKQILQNLWYDSAASPYLYDTRIYSMAMQILGPEKVLWGTDFPLLRPGRYFKEMDQAGLDPEARKALIGENARSLLAL